MYTFTIAKGIAKAQILVDKNASTTVYVVAVNWTTISYQNSKP